MVKHLSQMKRMVKEVSQLGREPEWLGMGTLGWGGAWSKGNKMETKSCWEVEGKGIQKNQV